MPKGETVSGSLYFYAPNKGAPVFFSVAFAAVGVTHLYQCHRFKSWTLTSLHPLCCFMFAVGFALREYGAFNYIDTTSNLNVYIASTCLIYMAPPLLELANFHVLGRILYFVPYCAPIHPGRVLTTFGILSSLVEVLNAIGVTYIANKTNPEKLIRLGDQLMKVGLCLQLAVIALFYLCAGVFHYRCDRARLTGNRKLLVPLITMYISTSLVLARTVYRTVEYFGESDLVTSRGGDDVAPILRYEWFFYVFEASLMLVNVFLWSVFHPRKSLPVDNRIFLEHDGVTETTGSGWKDDRNFLTTVIDPFGCLRHRKSESLQKE